MGKLRTINVELNRQYRNDLNWNFEQIEKDLDGNLSEIERVERESKERDNFLAGTNVDEIVQRIDTAATNAELQAIYAKNQGDYAKEQGDYAKEQGNYAKIKGDYANEKAILADQAAANAYQEASNLSALKVAVVDATQNANVQAQHAEQQGNYAKSQGDYAKQEADRIAGMDVSALIARVADLENGFASHLAEDAQFYFEEKDGNVFVNFRNKFFYVDEDGKVFFRPNGDGNSGASLGDHGIINIWKVG